MNKLLAQVKTLQLKSLIKEFLEHALFEIYEMDNEESLERIIKNHAGILSEIIEDKIIDLLKEEGAL